MQAGDVLLGARLQALDEDHGPILGLEVIGGVAGRRVIRPSINQDHGAISLAIDSTIRPASRTSQGSCIGGNKLTLLVKNFHSST